ncbi:MAG TPA: TIGR02206 family membrane protein, partial [Candidatus Dormibacteraeota bacterium]|nr:TIGR02206 family membrane protein [Candidatus Dormibacteraeota bacterium]
MSGLLSAEHLGALAGIAVATAVLLVAARRRRGAWLKVLAIVLVVDEGSWWVFLAAGGSPSQATQPLPLQVCDIAIFLAAAALWTRRPLLVELTYFWGVAGTLQAVLTPDLPQHFPSYPYFQYYIAHGGVVAAALILVAGLRIRP